MQKSQVRLLASLVLSAAGVASTQIWYQSYSFSHTNASLSQPLARILELSSEVVRKPTDRLIWQEMAQNDLLYDGDQLKTGDLSTARVEFLDSSTVVEIEPGSLITIENQNDNLVIDFIQGHLFVQESADPSKIQIKSAAGEKSKPIQVKTVISREESGELKVDASIASNSKDSSPVPVLKPTAYAEMYVDPNSEDWLNWELPEKVRSLDDIQLFVGPRRDQLKLVDRKAIRLSEKGFQARLSPGTYYWKLANREGEFSELRRMKVLPMRALLVVSPKADSSLEFEDFADVRLEWANPGRLKNVMLEIARSADLQEDRKVIPMGEKEWKVLRLSEEGPFYWRVTGFLSGTNNAVPSPVQKFSIGKKKVLQSALPPAEVAPTLLQGPSFLEADKPILAQPNGDFSVEWMPVSGAVKYKVEVLSLQGQTLRDFVTDSDYALVVGLLPGNYNIQVSAINAAGFKGERSALKSVLVPSISDARAPAFKGMELE